MEIQKVIQDVQQAVRKDIDTVNKWQTAGKSVREFYGTESAILEVKAQFIADCILPALDKRHATALARDLPRKNSKEYTAFVGTHGVQEWDNANQAKKDARATADTYFTRVVKYAFPSEKVESQPETPKTLETKLAGLINDAIGKCEKAETPAFDVAQCLTHLRAALAIVAK